MEDIRVVHACGDEESIAHLKPVQLGDNLLGRELLHASSIKNTPEHQAVTTILKGKKEPLPNSESFIDKGLRKQNN